MRVLQRFLDSPGGRRWIATQRRGRYVTFIISLDVHWHVIRCMEHTMHLASKAFIEDICPVPSHYKQKKASKSTTDTVQDDKEYDDEVAWLASLVDEGAAPEDEEIDDEMDFDPGDLLGKVLALVNQVSLQQSWLGIN